VAKNDERHNGKQIIKGEVTASNLKDAREIIYNIRLAGKSIYRNS